MIHNSPSNFLTLTKITALYGEWSNKEKVIETEIIVNKNYIVTID